MLKEWRELLSKYQQKSREFLDLTEEQESYLKNQQFDEFAKVFDQKKELMSEIDTLKDSINHIKNDYGDTPPEPFLSKLRELQQSARENIKEAMDKVDEMENKLSDRKIQTGRELKKIKEDRHTANTYLGQNNINKDSVFFDKKH